MDNTIVISTPPHVKAKQTTRSVMRDVCISLLPCAICGIVYFGWQALIIELISVIACVASEFCYFFIAKGGFSKKCKNAKGVCAAWLRQFDYTSIVTGLILALIIPLPEDKAKWYQLTYEVIIGAIFAIAIVKMLFGGTGKNLVNPAAAGRVFMFLSFSMTTYAAANFGAIFAVSEAISTGATNLSGSILAGNGNGMNLLDLFLGTGVAGCIGETCKLAILVGYIYLVIRKVLKWWQPLLFLVVFGFFSVLMSGMYYDPYSFEIEYFLSSILSGGVMFAAVFMFTDYVTSPKGVYGQLVYYIVAAALLAVLRYFTKIEVASFVIMLMNLLVPLIDKFFIRKPFGYVKTKKQKEGK